MCWRSFCAVRIAQLDGLLLCTCVRMFVCMHAALMVCNAHFLSSAATDPFFCFLLRWHNWRLHTTVTYVCMPKDQGYALCIRDRCITVEFGAEVVAWRCWWWLYSGWLFDSISPPASALAGIRDESGLMTLHLYTCVYLCTYPYTYNLLNEK